MTTSDSASAAQADALDRVSSELSSAVLGDVMNAMGLTCQFLPPE